MVNQPRQLSAEQHRERLKADRLLKKMDELEPFAESAMNQGFDVLRTAYSRRYRELIGVDPGRRNALRETLRLVRDGCGADVADAIAEAERAQPNG